MAQTSKWRRIGTNIAIGDYNDKNGFVRTRDGAGTIVDAKHEVRNECHIWLSGTSAIDTFPFDFPVLTDLTVILNGTLDDINADAGNIDVDMMGSLTGEDNSWVKLQDLVTWNSGGGAQAEAVAYGVYDIDANGSMPFMMIRCTPSGNGDSLISGVKINVFPV